MMEYLGSRLQLGIKPPIAGHLYHTSLRRTSRCVAATTAVHNPATATISSRTTISVNSISYLFICLPFPKASSLPMRPENQVQTFLLQT